MKKKKIQLGDIYQIPLPDGNYAYGRIFKDACIAIYKQLTTTPKQIPEKEEYQFIVGVYEDVLKSGKWEIVDNRPFVKSDEAWPPPMCIIDMISGKYSIYHKGEIKEATEWQCMKLEEAAVWDAHHIIDRIIGKDTWHKRMRA
jgi:hypothetical protein